MPSNQNPPGALPARFRRPRLLIVGCGDVGLRVARQLHPRVQLLALTSSAGRRAELRGKGVVPIAGNLDTPSTLARLAALGTHVLHLAPPDQPESGWWRDLRTRNLVRALRRRSPPAAFVYGSTSGVYGDCRGEHVPESRPARASTPRALRRVDAERMVRHYGRAAHVRSAVLRIPGIYAPDRQGGTPRQRLERGTAVLRAQDDVYTNHIHADDLARACIAALWRAAPQRAYNVCDDSALKMGDYFDLAADLYRLPRPPRVARAQAAEQLPLGMLGFMNESRRLDNTRLKRELRLALRHPHPATGLLKGNP